jgi:hypothetical protein
MIILLNFFWTTFLICDCCLDTQLDDRILLQVMTVSVLAVTQSFNVVLVNVWTTGSCAMEKLTVQTNQMNPVPSAKICR